jgi:hypothetical protein
MNRVKITLMAFFIIAILLTPAAYAQTDIAADDTTELELTTLEQNTAVAVPEKIPTNVKTQEAVRLPQWVGVGLAAVGIGTVAYGLLQNSEHDKLHKEYDNGKKDTDFDAIWKKAEDVREKRNMSYIIGSTLLSSGIFIYFVF